jgi:hypothetical protein
MAPGGRKPQRSPRERGKEARGGHPQSPTAGAEACELASGLPQRPEERRGGGPREPPPILRLSGAGILKVSPRNEWIRAIASGKAALHRPPEVLASPRDIWLRRPICMARGAIRVAAAAHTIPLY